MCLHGALIPIPFNLICNMTMGAGSACKIICYNAAAFVIPFNLICNMTMF